MKYSEIPEDVITGMSQEVYNNAVKHGWHEISQPAEHWLCLVVSEMMEAMEADRNNRHADLVTFYNHTKRNWPYCFEIYIKDTFEDEFADAAIRLLDMAATLELRFTPDNYQNDMPIPDCSFTLIAFSFIRTICRKPLNPTKFQRKFTLELIVNDALSFLFMLSEKYGFDLIEHIRLKMTYNASRPYKHGGKKY